METGEIFSYHIIGIFYLKESINTGQRTFQFNWKGDWNKNDEFLAPQAIFMFFCSS